MDINAFQHYNYLENWNKENNADLVSVADTYIMPIRIYSAQMEEQMPWSGKRHSWKGTIAVPNGLYNEAKAGMY